MKEYIAEAEKDLLHTYNRYQIVLDKGEGVHLYDTDGKKYLDFVAGIAVFALGYQNKAYNDALKAQIDKVIHTSNYYYNVPAIEAARKIKKVSGMDRVFFTNSGAEAVEGAIKAARKYAYLKDGCTDHEIIAEMVLNKVNKSLVQLVNELGIKAVGISGKDGMMLKCHKKLSKGGDIGFVGEVDEVDPQVIYDLLEKDFLPIICPIGYDENFLSYNINADDAACAIARAVKAEKLAFLTDVEGVYKDFEDKSSLISEMTVEEAQAFVDSGSLGGGMLPKLQNCIDAIENGVSRVHILDGRIAHCLLLEIFTNRGIGTAILGDKETKFYHE